jgi:hypothetical protein
MERPQRLARVFVELADTLVEEFDVVDFLQMITERCVEVLAADAAGLMLADQRGNLRLVASTLERAQLLELLCFRSRKVRVWSASRRGGQSSTSTFPRRGTGGHGSPLRPWMRASVPPTPCQCDCGIR